MRQALILFPVLILAATPMRADVFELAGGTWGLADYEPLSCGTNPHEVVVADDRGRVRFVWSRPMVNYEGDWDTEGSYAVLGHGPDHLVLALDGESRRTEDGLPVVWIMRLLDGGDRYCWGRTDWPAEECIDRYVRCPEPAPVS